MLKFYVKATETLRGLVTDKKGVVSFEYVIVAACIVVAVIAAFGISSTGNIATKLKDSITAILAKIVIT